MVVDQVPTELHLPTPELLPCCVCISCCRKEYPKPWLTVRQRVQLLYLFWQLTLSFWMIYISVPINNDGSKNCDYCCAVCLWSKPSLVIQLPHQGAAAFIAWFLYISYQPHLLPVLLGGPGVRVTKRDTAESCESLGDSTLGGVTWLQLQCHCPFCGVCGFVCGGICIICGDICIICMGHAHHGHAMGMSNCLRSSTWSLLY